MSRRHSSPPPRPQAQRARSHSLPMVEALGCSTPEAQLLLAEGTAAIRTRETRSQRSHPFTTFNPHHHLPFLNHIPTPQQAHEPATSTQPPPPPPPPSGHARIPSDSTDCSTCTLVLHPVEGESVALDNYSANLAKFVQAQLQNIPTYTSAASPHSQLSPRSCSDYPLRARALAQSSSPLLMRSVDAPRAIQIPPIRPPVQSQFSAWSSTDDGIDDDDDDDDNDACSLLPAIEPQTSNETIKEGERSPSILDAYGTPGDSSFSYSSSFFHDEAQLDVRPPSFIDLTSNTTGPFSLRLPSRHAADEGSSSSLSHPQLASDTSSASSCFYFGPTTAPSSVVGQRDDMIATIGHSTQHGNLLAAMSPWEGEALTNVHDILVESKHRVHTDGLSFDMQRDLVLSSHIGTPC